MNKPGNEAGDSVADEVIGNAQEIEPVPERTRDDIAKIEAESRGADLRLQKIVGYGTLGLMLAQLVVANYVFLKYADAKGWAKLPTGVIQAWLGATVVQVIGVVLVIARCVLSVGRSLGVVVALGRFGLGFALCVCGRRIGIYGQHRPERRYRVEPCERYAVVCLVVLHAPRVAACSGHRKGPAETGPLKLSSPFGVAKPVSRSRDDTKGADRIRTGEPICARYRALPLRHRAATESTDPPDDCRMRLVGLAWSGRG
jgi:hypothetical protein